MWENFAVGKNGEFGEQNAYHQFLTHQIATSICNQL